MKEDVKTYHDKLEPDRRAICELLYAEIMQVLPDAENKVWHGHPVWFLDGNPITGYDSLKDSVRLLFWSGQSFDEAGLAATGSFKAAEARYTQPDQISTDDLARWLQKSRNIQWDYKNIVKKRGHLDRLK